MPINKETILSVYDDKLTLMQWLKKVEDALKNDTLKDVKLLQNGNNVAFKFVFEDSEIITDYIELQANGIKAINYDSTTLQIVVTFTDGTTRVLGPLFDNQSNITVKKLTAQNVTTETINADNISVDGDVNSNGSISASDAVECNDLVGHNTISSMERIVDANDNFRFVEGSGTVNQSSKYENTYNKWSLSGTHLMIVFAGTLLANKTLENQFDMVDITIPQYIFNKIRVLFGTVSIDEKDCKFYGAGGSNTDTKNIRLIKTSGRNKVTIRFVNSDYTPTENKTFKIQFDLIIDAE